MQKGDFSSAQGYLESALISPTNLGEAKHLLANQSDIHYHLGEVHVALGDKKKAREHWRFAADFRGDFQEMSVSRFSEMTYFTALSLKALGKSAGAQKLFQQLLNFAKTLEKAEAKIDYFATSLPTMLLFDEDIQFRQQTSALFLQAQAHSGLGKRARAKTLLVTVLRRDPNHSLAADLLADAR